MKKSTGFWMGMSAGMVAGAAAACMLPSPQKRMKTPVGRSIQKMGSTVDRAVDNICSDLR